MVDYTLLEDWRRLMGALSKMSEQDMLDLMNYEKLSYRRKYVAERIHQKYCAVRKKREREELLSVCKY